MFQKYAWTHNTTAFVVLYNCATDRHAVITLGGMVGQV